MHGESLDLIGATARQTRVWWRKSKTESCFKFSPQSVCKLKVRDKCVDATKHNAMVDDDIVALATSYQKTEARKVN